MRAIVLTPSSCCVDERQHRGSVRSIDWTTPFELVCKFVPQLTVRIVELLCVVVKILLAEVLEVQRSEPRNLPARAHTRNTSVSPRNSKRKSTPSTSVFVIRVASSKHVYEFKAKCDKLCDQWIANIRRASFEVFPRHRRGVSAHANYNSSSLQVRASFVVWIVSVAY